MCRLFNISVCIVFCFITFAQARVITIDVPWVGQGSDLLENRNEKVAAVVIEVDRIAKTRVDINIFQVSVLYLNTPGTNSTNFAVASFDNQRLMYYSAQICSPYSQTSHIGFYSDQNGTATYTDIACNIDTGTLNSHIEDFKRLGIHQYCHYFDSGARLISTDQTQGTGSAMLSSL